MPESKGCRVADGCDPLCVTPAAAHVLQVLREGGSMTFEEISERTGIRPLVIENAVGELVVACLVRPHITHGKLLFKLVPVA